jgi:cephalosporin-C deacetylase-like acetyl esterase
MPPDFSAATRPILVYTWSDFKVVRPIMPNSKFTLAAIFLAATLLPSAIYGQAPPTRKPAINPNSPENLARTQLNQYLNALADQEEAARAKTIAAIKTPAQARARQTEVRKKILALIGGLPTERTPLNAKSLGTWQGDGFRIERIIFDSQPGFHVTADLYLPDATGPFAAIIDTPGHGATGKLGEYQFAGNFARNGIAVLAVDPLGQGERSQYFDADTGKSKVGASTGEHGEASVSTMLIGEHISRYFLWDSMRALDYLASRPDIDTHRIGAFGCSGGGTDTAYFAALDPRLRASAVACYITSEHELLNSLGPQDAEQSIPDFISSGLDFPDWIELVAPRPYAIVSTTSDMFPYAGATTSHAEAQHFYSIFGAANQLDWIVGPGGHGNLRPITPQIIAFFQQSLNNTPTTAPLPVLTQLQPAPPSALLCTTTGQLANSIGSETIFWINRNRAEELIAHRTAPTAASLRADIIALTHLSAKPTDAPPQVTVVNATDYPDKRIEKIIIHSEPGIDIPATLISPITPGKYPASIVLLPHPDLDAYNDSTLDYTKYQKRIILLLGVRPSPAGVEELKSSLLGTDYLLSLRAMLVGKTLLGMRIDDITRTINYLAALPNVEPQLISLTAPAPYSSLAIHAAVIDQRLRSITIPALPQTYQQMVETELHQNISDNVLPGVLRRYDLPDLEKFLQRRLHFSPNANVLRTQKSPGL